MLPYYCASVLAVFLLGMSHLLFWPMLPVAWGAARQIKTSSIYLLAFVTGILHDLIWSKPIGAGAIFLVLLCVLTVFLQKRFKSQNRIFLLVLVLGQVGYIVLSQIGFI